MMTLSRIVELARQDSPPTAPSTASVTIARVEHVRASQVRVLVVACAVSVAMAAIALSAMFLSGPSEPDPVEQLLVSIEWRLP